MTRLAINKQGRVTYKVNGRFRQVYDEFNDLTKSFKRDFRKGLVEEMPRDYLYNSVSNRFYENTKQNRTRFKSLELIDNVFQPANTFDYIFNMDNTKRNVQANKFKVFKLEASTPKYTTSTVRKAFQNYVSSHQYNNPSQTGGFGVINRVISDLHKEYQVRGTIKFLITLKVVVKKPSGEMSSVYLGEKIISPVILANQKDIATEVKRIVSKFQNYFDDFEGEGSGWVFQHIENVYLHILNYQAPTGGSYIDLPKKLKQTNACINPKNEKDNECIVWCLAIYNALQAGEKKDLQRISKLKKYKPTLSKEYKFPFEVKKQTIEALEKDTGLSINVFAFDEALKASAVIPKHLSSFKVEESKQVDLLMITNKDTTHFVYVKNINALLGTITQQKRGYYCRYCLNSFSTKPILHSHIENGCRQITGGIKCVYPEPNTKLKFKNFKKQFKAPFVVYADLETALPSINYATNENEKTHTINQHLPTGYCLYVVCADETVKFTPRVFRANTYEEQKEVIPRMIKTLKGIGFDLMKKCQQYKDIEQMKMTDNQVKEYNKATHCHICSEKVSKKEKVRDHCHLTGQYIGAAHNACNINRNERHRTFPLYFHNMKGYDSHFLIKEFKKADFEYTNKKGETRSHDFKVVANTSEKFITFQLYKFQVLDTLAFLNSSLDKLVSLLKREDFYHTKTHISDTMFNLAIRKGVYPYEYVDNVEKFKETKLPAIDKFYSRLTESGISEKDYAHAQKVWKTGQMTNLGDYHDFYLKTDVLLLADVFETFRERSMNDYGLDPANYWTLPGYGWDAMLKMTTIEMDLLSDPDMFLMCEKGIRGGVSLIAQRHARADNKYINEMKGIEEPVKDSSYIMYWDANNLYGGGNGMSGKLPYANFEWIENVEQYKTNDTYNLDFLTEEEDKGYILEVDLEYPDSIHDLHNDLPVAPENILISDDMLSKTQADIKQRLNIKGAKVKKLVPNLNNKNKYVLHYKNLLYYVSLGLKLTHIHRAIKFSHKAFMKPYIDFNTAKRQQASQSGDKFGKNFYRI